MRSTTDQDRHGQPAGAWLLQQHRLFIARYARQLGRGVAEDLASEAIVRSLRHPAPDGRHGPWLERVFRNLLVDHLRRHARGQQAQVMPDAPRTDSPEQRAAEAQLRRRLAALWPELRPEWQQALASSFGADESGAPAVPAVTGTLSPTTVRTRTFRALGVLRRALGVMRGWVPLPLGGQLQPLAAALLPGAVAVTALVTPLPPPADLHPAPVARIVAQASARPAAPPRPAPAAAAPVQRRPTRARSSAPPAPPAPAPTDAPKPIQRFEYNDDDITGALHRPDDFIIQGAPGRGRHRSLIEIPGSFAVAMMRTLEDL